MNKLKLLTVLITLTLAACDVAGPEPRPTILQSQIIGALDGIQLGVDSFVGDTVTIRVRAVDASLRGSNGVTITADVVSGTGSIDARRRTTDSDGWTEFFFRAGTTVNHETGRGGAAIQIAADTITRIVVVGVAPLAPASIVIESDSLLLNLASKPAASIPADLRDRLDNPVFAARAVWVVREPAIAQALAAGAPHVIVLGLEPGDTWIVAYGCDGKHWLCADAPEVFPADSFFVTVQ